MAVPTSQAIGPLTKQLAWKVPYVRKMNVSTFSKTTLDGQVIGHGNGNVFHADMFAGLDEKEWVKVKDVENLVDLI